jgi:putative endonuclease
MMHWLYLLADRARHRARMRLWSGSQAAGRRGEDLAHRFLQRLGFSVVARNYRAHGQPGEIDIIAWDGGTLVIAEVKSLATGEYSSPDRAIDPEKQWSLFETASVYRRRAGVDWDRVRFDTVSVLLTDPPAITLRRDAFHPQRSSGHGARRFFPA